MAGHRRRGGRFFAGRRMTLPGGACLAAHGIDQPPPRSPALTRHIPSAIVPYLDLVPILNVIPSEAEGSEAAVGSNSTFHQPSHSSSAIFAATNCALLENDRHPTLRCGAGIHSKGQRAPHRRCLMLSNKARPHLPRWHGDLRAQVRALLPERAVFRESLQA